MLIDTHVHFNLEGFEDVTEAIAEAQAVGVGRFIVVGIDEESSRKAVSLAERHAEIYAVVGVHPNSCANFNDSDLGWIRELATHKKCVGIGEIGWDYHWDLATPIEQMRALIAQFNLANELGKAIVYHCREAYDDLATFIEGHISRVNQIVHCFSGTAQDLSRLLSVPNLWVGVDGPITFKSNTAGRAMIASIDRERVLLETDAPFLAPVPFRGKPNHPKYLPLIAAEIGRCWYEPNQAESEYVKAVGNQTWANAQAAFSQSFGF